VHKFEDHMQTLLQFSELTHH